MVVLLFYYAGLSVIHLIHMSEIMAETVWSSMNLIFVMQVLALPLPKRPLFPGFYLPIYVKVQLILS